MIVIGGGKPNYIDRYTPLCDYIHHKFHQDYPGVESSVLGSEATCLPSEHGLKVRLKLRNLAECRSDDILLQKLIQP